MNKIICNYSLRGENMGYYLKVNNVKLYVEDLNPECKKTILFYTAGRAVTNCLNTN